MKAKKAGKMEKATPDSALSELVEAVEGSSDFCEWRKSNKSAYLSSIFTMAGNAGELYSHQNEWLLSYYDKDDDTFTTFSSAGSRKAAGEQAFKKGRELPALEPGKVNVGILGSMRTAEDVRNRAYHGEEASRIIAILQPLGEEEIFAVASDRQTKKRNAAKAIRPVWNITYITSAFNVLNIKIDAGTGEVLAHKLSGVMDFVQKDAKGGS